MSAVYFLKAIEAGWIKIGCSKRPLLKVIEGERDVECAWHRRFKHLRGCGGWFRAERSKRKLRGQARRRSRSAR